MKRLYYEDSYIQEFEAVVTECKNVNGKFLIELSQTAFYPEGGGQSCDVGEIGEAKISDVREKDGVIIHTADRALKPGNSYSCKIDWERRYDFMRQHTAEHIISGIIKSRFGADNVGFNLGEDYVTMDYNTRLTEEDIIFLEREAERAVCQCKPVTIKFIENQDEAEYRSKKEISGKIRIVDAGGWDTCACCGTHTKSTGELGLIKIISNQNYKSGCRLLMVCGARALKDYGIKHRNTMEISAMLSAKPLEINLEVERLLQEKAEMRRECNELKSKYFDLAAKTYDYTKAVCVFEENLTPDDLRRFITVIMQKAKICAVFSGDDDSGYKYAAFSKVHEPREFSKILNTALKGKGGGKDIIQGTVTKGRKAIEEFLDGMN